MDRVSKMISASEKIIGADWAEPSPPSPPRGHGARGAAYTQQSGRCELNATGRWVNVQLQTEAARRGSKERLSSTEDTYLLSVRCPMTAPASWKNKSPLSLSHAAYSHSHSHPALPAMFAPVILKQYSPASLETWRCREASSVWWRNTSHCASMQQLWRRVSMNYTCVRGWQ